MEWLHGYEVQINIFLQSMGLWLAAPMRDFTFIGQPMIFQIIYPVLLWTVSANFGIAIGLVLLLNSFTNDFFKFLFHGSRPYWIDPAVKALSVETTFGIPSGHSENIAAMMTFLALNLRRRWITVTAVLLIVAVGFSRVYLGAHYLSDVVVGWLLGILVALLVFFNRARITAWVTRLTLPAQILLALASSFLLIAVATFPQSRLQNYSLPAEWVRNAALGNKGVPLEPLDTEEAFQAGGTWFGLLAGAAWLKKTRGSFEEQGTILQRLIRLVVGLPVLFLLRYGATIILPDPSVPIHYAVRYLVYALIGLWITWGAPIVFVRLRLSRFCEEAKPVPFLGYLEKNDRASIGH